MARTFLIKLEGKSNLRLDLRLGRCSSVRAVRAVRATYFHLVETTACTRLRNHRGSPHRSRASVSTREKKRIYRTQTANTELLQE